MKVWVPLVLVCCLIGNAAPAAAQFTAAVVPPPPPERPEGPLIAHADSVKRPQDSAAARTLTSMKVWVDSAALAFAQQPATPADTTATPAAAAPAGEHRAAAKSDTSAARVNVSTGEVGRFRNGAPAPATATPLPLLALLGVASVIAGALLRRRRT